MSADCPPPAGPHCLTGAAPPAARPPAPAVWRLLFFSGRIATRLAVSQDYHAGTMNIQLAPGPPRTPDCKQVPIEKLEARWAVKPLSECLDAAADILPDIPPEARGEPAMRRWGSGWEHAERPAHAVRALFLGGSC